MPLGLGLCEAAFRRPCGGLETAHTVPAKPLKAAVSRRMERLDVAERLHICSLPSRGCKAMVSRSAALQRRHCRGTSGASWLKGRGPLLADNVEEIRMPKDLFHLL